MKNYEIIIKDIKKQIKNGILKSGDKLPTEKEYEKIYGVSRITVQTAMQKLKDENIIFRRAGSGSYLADIPMPSSAEKNFITFICYNSVNELMSIIEGANCVIEKNNLYISMKITNGNPDVEHEAVLSSIEKGTRGILIFPTEQEKEKNIMFLQDLVIKKFPIVFIDRNPLKNYCNFVSSNNYMGARLVTEHLIRYGHKNICYINAGVLQPLQDRIRGFHEALRYADLPINKDSVLYIKDPITSQYSDFSDIDSSLVKIFKKENHPTALVCCNDLIALHCIKQLRAMHFKIPEDVSVTGYDNILQAASSSCRLTTIDQDFFGIGHTAATLLLNYIENKQQISNILIDPRLIIRGSTKRL